jgi:NAD(P)-dependent dehydrogenase (short-subunit alcohol dehydrogenase family)
MSNPTISDWTGRRVWILGASSGIGAALARELAARGAQVAVSARRHTALQALAKDLPHGLALTCDASDPQQIAAVAAKLHAQWGGIDMAIYAAGVWYPMDATELSAEAIDATLDINLRGAMHFAATVIPLLRQAGAGSLAFIGSVAGYRALPRAVVYGTSKAALAYFAATLHLELAPIGIGVYLVSPGFVDTPMTVSNDFPMPAIIPPEQAAKEIVAGFASGDFEIHFPKRLTRPMRWARMLPDGLYFPLVRKLTSATRK